MAQHYKMTWGGPESNTNFDVGILKTDEEWVEINQRRWGIWYFETFIGLDFTAWDRYHEWLMTILPGGDDGQRTR